jgi:O-succinylhomoserine sulfhydrylase
VTTTFVSPTDVSQWEAAIQPNTRLLFLETPSNPLTEVADIEALGVLARRMGALLVVDNCFCTPALQRPIEMGADIVIHSATKYLDGQGRVLGGAVLGKRDLIQEPLTTFLRNAGPTLSPFNAWVILKGLETLKLRMQAHSANALVLARWLEGHPRVERVFYPGLPSHPQHQLAQQQQASGGGIVSFVVKGGREAAWRVVDATRMISITANLGDVKTTRMKIAAGSLEYGTQYASLPNAAQLAVSARKDIIPIYALAGDPRWAYDFLKPLSGDSGVNGQLGAGNLEWCRIGIRLGFLRR